MGCALIVLFGPQDWAFLGRGLRGEGVLDRRRRNRLFDWLTLLTTWRNRVHSYKEHEDKGTTYHQDDTSHL